MAATDIVIENPDDAPSWPEVRGELWLLFIDLMDDPRYGERVNHILELLGEPQSPALVDESRFFEA
jgi:hypothetical protein